MATNLEKYKKYEAIMDKLGHDFAMSFFPNGLPDKVYRVSINHTKYKNGYYVQEAKVDKIMYHFKENFRKPYFDKRPNRENVSKIKKIVEGLTCQDLNEEDICLHVSDGRTSWGMHLKDFKEGNNASFVKNTLEPIVKGLVEKYVPKEGQFKCEYCGKATDIDKKVVDTVISRQYTNFKKEFDYCSGRCAAHNQMAHEG